MELGAEVCRWVILNARGGIRAECKRLAAAVAG